MKKMLAPALALACLLSLSVSAFAATQRAATEEMAPCAADGGHSYEKAYVSGEITPMGAPCPQCGQYTVSSTKEYSSWAYTGALRVCPTNSNYNDKEQGRTVTVVTTCKNCSFASRNSYDEYRWYCVNRHYAHPN